MSGDVPLGHEGLPSQSRALVPIRNERPSLWRLDMRQVGAVPAEEIAELLSRHFNMSAFEIGNVLKQMEMMRIGVCRAYTYDVGLTKERELAAEIKARQLALSMRLERIVDPAL